MPVSRLQALVLTLLALLPLALASSLPLHPRDDDDDEPGLHGNPTLRTTAHIAHGVTISVAVILFFPLGGILLRLMQLHPPRSLNPISFHIYWQLAGLFVLCVGFGLGCWLSYLHNELWDFGHEQMGTVIFGLFLLQPILGVVHHVKYQRLSEKGEVDDLRTTWAAKIHVWYGRSLIVLGAVCGGTGIQLAANWTVPQMLVYLVVTVVVAAVYVGVLWVWWGKGRGRRRLRLGTPSLEKLPLGLPGERLDLPGGLFGSGSARGSEEKIVRVEEKRG
ncbi:hypothetical protein N431DRAFT_463102 [Stipitochalara longipes BDJ]|nr:hypothetical protein N431DRAFT_463102 [Stipitochalara longipes BDJ]